MEELETVVAQEANRLWSRHRAGYKLLAWDKDDLRQLVWIAALEAQRTHREDLAPLTAWVRLSIRHKILTEVRQAGNGDVVAVPLNDPDETPDSNALTNEHREIRQLVSELGENDEDISILIMRIYGEMSFIELEELTGYSRTTLWRRIETAKSKLSRLI